VTNSTEAARKRSRARASGVRMRRRCRFKIRCEVVERGRHGRLVAKCFSTNGVDIGRRLVPGRVGPGRPGYSMDHVDAEEEARRAKRGIWQGNFHQALGVARHCGSAEHAVRVGRP
jgi:endonuclease YncB( thermonuclease family)